MAAQPQLEALLRLKRSENPDAQFWERFDAELHQRMLRTLVQKEPWYRQLYYAFLRPKVQLLLRPVWQLFGSVYLDGRLPIL